MRWCDGNYLEDQDMWRLSGIPVIVTRWRAQPEHLYDVQLTPDLDKAYKNANLHVQLTLNTKPYPLLGYRSIADRYTGSADTGHNSFDTSAKQTLVIPVTAPNYGRVNAQFIYSNHYTPQQQREMY